MGSCSSIIKPSQDTKRILSLCCYSTKVLIKLKNKKSSNPQEIISSELHLTKPLQTSIEAVPLNNQIFWVSSSVLPGQDPHCEVFQKCMDTCLYLSDETSILLALFDGHGPEGESVINSCSVFTSKFYRKQKSLLNVTTKKSNANEFLLSLVEGCDKTLYDSDKSINVTYSGSTALFVVIKDNFIYSASVGDSRAILATSCKRDPIIDIAHRAENEILSVVKQRRGSKLENEIYHLQLTKDHKPDIKEETSRILESGGRVKRLMDDEGNKIGPYRVWEANVNAPGLTMSRSIGDSLAKSIGVISTPDVTVCKLDVSHDLFIVIGSDGIWDAMDNDDVVNYVEFFREKSCRVNKPCKDVIDFENSCIARLLCEEARVRWLAIAEQDDVSIDDISCIVLEFKKAESGIQLKQKKQVVKSGEINNERGGGNDPQIAQLNLKDPRRGSQINFAITLHQVISE